MKKAEDARDVLISKIPIVTWERFGIACKAQGRTIKDTVVGLVADYINRPEIKESIAKKANSYLL